MLRKTRQLPILIALILIAGLTTPARAQRDGPLLDDISWRATHNSYSLDHTPAQLIDLYNIWEVEIDFGKDYAGAPFEVGHDGPGDAFGENGMSTLLSAWFQNIRSTTAWRYHPVFIKLDAKLVDTCGDPTCWFCCWRWTSPGNWGGWQNELRTLALDTLGPENVFGHDEFTGSWPALETLAGKFVLQLRAEDMDQICEDPVFFKGDWPGLGVAQVHDPADLTAALKADVNRIVYDSEYTQYCWSGVLLQAPIPAYVDGGFGGYPWGTSLRPFRCIGEAVNANWTHDGVGALGYLVIPAGTYAEKLTISTAMTLTASSGVVTIGGSSVTYGVTITLQDVGDAGTTDRVYARLFGSAGSTSEFELGTTGCAFAGSTSYHADDIGAVQAVEIRVGGDDDTALDAIYVDSSVDGRHIINATLSEPYHGWVGEDHNNPQTFYVP